MLQPNTMKVTTVRLPESLYESLESEARENEMSVAEHIRAVLRNRGEHTQANTPATSPGDAPAEYAEAEAVAELRERVADLEDRVDGVESELAQPTNGRPEIDTGEVPLLDSDPYPEAVETALALVEQADQHVPKRAILSAVPDEDISDESLWQRHIRPALSDSPAEHTRNKGWLWESGEE